MKTIGVFFGGESVEHDVSIITGTLTVNSLNEEKYIGVPIYISHDGVWYCGEGLKDIDGYKNLNLKKLQRVTLKGGDNCLYAIKGNRLKRLFTLSCAINCIHGEGGEDGCLAGLLKYHNIPLASPDMIASSTAISKSSTKIILKGLGVKTLPYITVSSVSECALVGESLSFPLFVKPDCGGSSIGVGKATDVKELETAVANALRYGERVIIEPFIENFTEINCACYQGEKGIVLSECEKPIKGDSYLSFGDKYLNGAREFPAKIPNAIAQKIKNVTKKVYQAFNLQGVIRIDFMLIDGKVYLNEINTVPGSLAYYLFSDTLKGFTQMLDGLIAVAEKNMAKSQTLIKKFNSSIILGLQGSKGSKRLKNNN